MRELKFRQALMSFGKFCGWHYWGFIKGKFVSPAESSECPVANAEKHSYQFTGLKDKAGKEIYEGDIVNSGIGNDNPFVIDWVDCSARFALTTNRYAAEWTIDASKCEVIGNVYENPELLKVSVNG